MAIKMSGFLYELHFHTRESSPCGEATAAEMIREYKKRGYTGVIVTDHFVNFNRYFCDPALSWSDKIRNFQRGYLAAKEEGDRIGVDVFFGYEYNYRQLGDDFVTFGADAEFLTAHPELCDLSLPDYTALIHRAGGLVWQAHPFRRAAYLGDKPVRSKTFPEVDGVEILNGRPGHEEFNREALDWAKAHSLPGFAGSDAHFPEDISAGIFLPRRAENAADLLSLLKQGGFSFYSSRYETADFDAYSRRKP